MASGGARWGGGGSINLFKNVVPGWFPGWFLGLPGQFWRIYQRFCGFPTLVPGFGSRVPDFGSR
eukprot:8751928-Alexandrium_andersonii.AAC.1